MIRDYIQACASKEFEWGRWDCALFASDVVCCLTGKDYGKRYRGRYSDGRAAERLIGSLGGLDGIARDVFGLQYVSGLPKDGDIGVAETVNGNRCFAAFFQGQWLAAAPRGLALIKGKRIESIYRIK